ncbi:GTPase domain-containing protein [Alkaliphilus serpentinus]|uniref:G domain-containing protein n=1 Tax=Alkaliphilus serpentinus TaxID=1482731 RepID=A0A833MD24_9FIRM|nr:GTPase domain-containing protein [Alkaliphilus serpentinus]KAB3527251.1 hypothetical protein F8153_12690 [Alkaliphilus serpentinus]
MKKCILIGKSNVGKTSFFVSFVEYLGIKRLNILFKGPQGGFQYRSYTTEMAKSLLISESPFKTKEICEIGISVPVYKGNKVFQLQDTSGIVDGMCRDDEVRKSMVLTFKTLEEAGIILHMIDTSRIFRRGESTIGPIDDQINLYGTNRGSYCILASKTDLEDGEKGYELLRKKYCNSLVIPVSTFNQRGYKEVMEFVVRNL